MYLGTTAGGIQRCSTCGFVYLNPLIHRHYADYADRFRSARHIYYFIVSIHRTPVAKQIYKFPQSSLAELARNSVIQSGFEMEVKRHWLGQNWYLPGDAGNEITKVCSRFLFEISLSSLLPLFCACILIADLPLQHVSDQRPEQSACL